MEGVGPSDHSPFDGSQPPAGARHLPSLPGALTSICYIACGSSPAGETAGLGRSVASEPGEVMTRDTCFCYLWGDTWGHSGKSSGREGRAWSSLPAPLNTGREADQFCWPLVAEQQAH